MKTESEVFELAQKHANRFRSGDYKCIGEALRSAIREAWEMPAISNMPQCDKCGRNSNSLIEEEGTVAKRRRLCPYCVIDETENLPTRNQVGGGFDMNTTKR